MEVQGTGLNVPVSRTAPAASPEPVRTAPETEARPRILRSRDEYVPEDGEKKTTMDTGKVDREIKALRQEREVLERRLRAEEDPARTKELEQRLRQVEEELRRKDNDTYRRQHASVS